MKKDREESKRGTITGTVNYMQDTEHLNDWVVVDKTEEPCLKTLQNIQNLTIQYIDFPLLNK